MDNILGLLSFGSRRTKTECQETRPGRPEILEGILTAHRGGPWLPPRPLRSRFKRLTSVQSTAEPLLPAYLTSIPMSLSTECCCGLTIGPGAEKMSFSLDQRPPPVCCCCP